MNTKQVIVIRKDLKMRKGKMCAQAAHASLGVFINKMVCASFGNAFVQYGFHVEKGAAMEKWLQGAFTKIVLYVESEEELLEIYRKAESEALPRFLCTDAGKTEFHGVPTNTCVAIGPAESEVIDKITGHLKLL